MKKTLLTLTLICVMVGGQAQLPTTVRNDFAARKADLKLAGATQRLNQLAVETEVYDALTFLYAYMPWPDMADYTADYYATQAACAVRARHEMSWGKKVPDREWYHFVLPVRVNNENLDTFRTAKYEELKRRVAGKSMKEAVLEVNHWCHEYVTYKPSDARTSSPLASMRTATGRCGEESTFTVAALRAVGIPARQVYTPRWAHTDDNHAWVEAWVDGEWYFLGACEPEPVLNLGWFNQPASRGMLMHTKVYGRYAGDEDVISRTPCYTEINVTRNYAPVARQGVLVCDEAGHPVADANIDFKIYNYAEFYTVQHTRTDSQGMAFITAGLGDLVAWASKNGRYGFSKLTVGQKDVVRVELTHRTGETSFVKELNITPPVGHNNLPALSEEEIAENDRRKAREDAIRTDYVQSFPDSARIAAFCQEEELDFRRIRPLVEKSCGNYANVLSLIRNNKGSDRHNAIDLLETVSDKDLRDFSLEVLQDHLENRLSAFYRISSSRGETNDPLNKRYVLSPRIANELITPWRGYFRKAFSAREQAAFRKDPSKLARWIKKNIKTDAVWNPQGYCLSPEAAHRTRRADVRSQGLLFVAAARSMGIPARLNEVTGKVQYFAPTKEELANGILARHPEEQEWKEVCFAPESRPTSTGSQLKLGYTPRRYMENPVYYSHFTLSKLNNGRPVLLNYPETDSWAATFKEGTPVDGGDYLLTSGTRLADGSVLARLSVFPVAEKTPAEAALVMREDREKLQVIGNFNAENLYYDCSFGKEKSLLSTTGRGYYVAGLIRANHEPSNHILHDLEKLRPQLESWGRPILLLFPSQAEWERFEKVRHEFSSLPSTVRFGIDESGQVGNDIFGSGLTRSNNLPVMFLADTFNRVVFMTQGYTIGIGEQIKQALEKIN